MIRTLVLLLGGTTIVASLPNLPVAPRVGKATELATSRPHLFAGQQESATYEGISIDLSRRVNLTRLTYSAIMLREEGIAHNVGAQSRAGGSFGRSAFGRNNLEETIDG